jgi:hypothetical protein
LVPAEPAGDEIQADHGDQPGADVTARLLLALTGLYVQRSNHTAEDQQQFTELALRLIDKAGPATRAAVAARLRHHPDAPAAVIERLDGARLSHDGPDGAPSHSAQDQRADRPARQGPPEAGSNSEVAPYVGLAALALAARELAAREPGARQPADGQSTPPVSAPAARRPALLTPEYGEAFFAAAPPERRRMLSEIAATDAAGAAPENGRRFHVRIDTAPWHGRTGAFARDFARLIDAPASLCERILNDPSGEPLVVAARATGMPAAMLQRMLLLVCPATNHSVQRVYDLTELYHVLDPRTAHALLAAWRNAATPDGEARPLAAPVTNLRARLAALNARIENQTSRESATRSSFPPPAGRR